MAEVPLLDFNRTVEATPPSPEQAQAENDKAIVAEVRGDYNKWREYRRRHEGNWFRAGAFLRGQQHVEFNEGTAQLVAPTKSPFKVRLDINRTRPKVLARLSKFFKNRPKPVVVPASTDYQDQLDAKATEKVLNYHWDRLHLEEKHKDAKLWSSIGGKSYWFIYLDDYSPARIQTMDEATGEAVNNEVTLPDVCIDVASPFEVLVADPAISRIGDQPGIMRVRMMPKADMQARYPHLKLDGTFGTKESGNYPDRLATLKAGGGTGKVDRPDQTMVMERFIAPCGKYPKGRKTVVCDDELAIDEQELPFGMWDHKINPYPVVEFTDGAAPGQFWPTTLVEQLMDIQRQYNYLFELLTENARACARPKIIVYKQHNLADGAWTTAAGEIVELTYVPGLPAPIILQPANISGDVWQLIQTFDRLFDEISQVYPASEGAVAKSTSGFQTNLLQEANNSVHAPDVREDELSLQEAAWKIRRLCKLAYDVPRLFSILGENSLPEVMEFSRKQVDEYAEVRIQAGSMLPEMKSAKVQSALELFKSGLFGNPADPIVRHKVLGLLDAAGMEALREDDRRDADEAELEQRQIEAMIPVLPGQFYQNHIIHIEKHQNYIKSPAFDNLDPQAQQNLIAHVITHYDWVNPILAMGLRQSYGLTALPIATPPPPPGMAPLGAPAPTPGTPPGAPPPPETPQPQ